MQMNNKKKWMYLLLSINKLYVVLPSELDEFLPADLESL